VLTSEQINKILSDGLRHVCGTGRKVLLIVPDATREAPVADMVPRLLALLHDSGAHADIVVALGTHQPMPEKEMRRHLGFADPIVAKRFSDVKLMNHTWDDPSTIISVGRIPADRMDELTGGLMPEEVDLTLNKIIHDYDRLLVLGPVLPHAVAGFSGGSKYLFPGISGPEMIDYFHWLGAIITNLKINGIADNPVRRVLDEAASHVPMPVDAACLVVKDGDLEFVAVGPLFDAWRAAVKESAKAYIIRKPRLYHRALSCCPAMYDDFWTGGKPIYNVEPVVEDGGEVIVYAPHIESLSVTHEATLRKIGYHVADYYLKQMEKFDGISRAVMAVSAFIKGSGTYENGVEKARIRVTLASKIPKDEIERLGLNYADPASINFEDWKDREDEGILFVENAGETLYLPE
jgi:nickel-dependent lactate racemase